MRAGWSFDDEPYLKFRNLVAKPKTSINKQIDALNLVGSELNQFDGNKLQKKTMFDKNVVYQLQSLEHTLDFTFSHLGFQNDTQIEYPLLLTEPFCNPNYSRSLVSELLFECFNIPALSYCVDSLLSFYYNTHKLNGCSEVARTGILIDSSHASTHIVPVIDQQWQLPLTKRISIGGHHHTELLTKSVALRFPELKNQINGDIIQEL